MTKRICLFAGYDSSGLIHDYVVNYVQELSEISDVYYLADCIMASSELAKLSSFTISAEAYRHEMYDFGSWKLLIDTIGIEKLCEYDELILSNDSCFGPFYPLSPIFEKMNSRTIDFWGLTACSIFQTHLQSFFIVFKRNVFISEAFIKFFKSIKKESSVMDVILNYETKLTPYLSDEGYTWDSFIPQNVISKKYPNPTIVPFTLLSNSFPLLKVKVFTCYDFSWEYTVLWKYRISSISKYNTNFINSYIRSKRLSSVVLWNSRHLLKIYSMNLIRAHCPPLIFKAVKNLRANHFVLRKDVDR